jgi:hypothetical protein
MTMHTTTTEELGIGGAFDAAVQLIDERFGEGYAKKNPTLLGSTMAEMAATARLYTLLDRAQSLVELWVDNERDLAGR